MRPQWLLLSLGLTAVIALLAAGALYPWLQRIYYLRELRSSDVRDRGAALTALAALAEHDPSVHEPLLQVLCTLFMDPSADARQQAFYVTAWLVENVTSIAPRIEAVLRQADDDLFIGLAEAMIAGGTWTRDRPMAQRGRLAALRYARCDDAYRAETVSAMADLGPLAATELSATLDDALQRPDPVVRRTALRVSAVLGDTPRVIGALSDADAEVRAAALTWLVTLEARSHARHVMQYLVDDVPAVREAAAFALARLSPDTAEPHLARRVAEDPDSRVRGMASWFLGICPQDDERDARVRSRALLRVAERGTGDTCFDALTTDLDSQDVDLRYACIAGLSTVTAHRQPAIVMLRDRAERALQTGHDGLAAMALQALAALGDEAFLPVMLDTSERLVDTPMLRYIAASAATTIDPDAGVQALLDLFALETDTPRDLAARHVAGLEAPPIERLVALLGSLNDETRMAAAFALGLIGRADVHFTNGASLTTFLDERTDPQSPYYEDHWKVRGYYHLARHMLGAADAQRSVDPLLLHDRFPRTAVYTALLAVGDTLPMDELFFGDDVELDAFLRDHRFADVIARCFPDAPSVTWHGDEPLRRWQIDRLRDWWQVWRIRVQWDAQTGRFSQ